LQRFARWIHKKTLSISLQRKRPAIAALRSLDPLKTLSISPQKKRPTGSIKNIVYFAAK